ncbi:MAG TPA: hypothetical protein VF727_12775 [Allosphingosinicella sp.]|jgi:hypothetical protein
MRSYAAVTGTAFLLLALGHLARLLAEGSGPLRNPIFVATTVIAIAFAAWAAVTVRRASR